MNDKLPLTHSESGSSQAEEQFTPVTQAGFSESTESAQAGDSGQIDVNPYQNPTPPAIARRNYKTLLVLIGIVIILVVLLIVGIHFLKQSLNLFQGELKPQIIHTPSPFEVKF